MSTEKSPQAPAHSNSADSAAIAANVATFEAFMTLFGDAQQALKIRMQDQAEQGLGPLHLRALVLCARAPGGTQQQLVQSLGRDKGQIARLIRDLEDRNYLVRTPDTRDRRAWCLTVTPEGEQKCVWFSAIEADVATALFGGVDATQCLALHEQLAQLQARFDVLLLG
jgi:DNA-binding MarR family transcriptional regulator